MSEMHALSDAEPPAVDVRRNVFFALRPDEAVVDSIIAAADALIKVHAANAGRRLKRERLHLTVLYLDVFPTIPQTYLQHAIETGDEIDAAPFDFSLDVAGSFRTNDVPWWLGCSNVPAELLALHQQLYTGMRSRGEKVRGGPSLTPHVTISRSNREVLPQTPIAPIHWHVDEVFLIERVMGRRAFDIINTWKLRGNG